MCELDCEKYISAAKTLESLWYTYQSGVKVWSKPIGTLFTDSKVASNWLRDSTGQFYQDYRGFQIFRFFSGVEVRFNHIKVHNGERKHVQDARVFIDHILEKESIYE